MLKNISDLFIIQFDFLMSELYRAKLKIIRIKCKFFFEILIIFFKIGELCVLFCYWYSTPTELEICVMFDYYRCSTANAVARAFNRYTYNDVVVECL